MTDLLTNDNIRFEAGVGSKRINPYVNLKWGSSRGQFSPKEIRAHAMGLMKEATAAELDACLTKLMIEKFGVSKKDARKMIFTLRQKREQPSIILDIDGDHMSSEAIKQAAEDMLYMSFGAQAEAFLFEIISKHFEQPLEVTDRVIQEFRHMRGALSVWPRKNKVNRE